MAKPRKEWCVVIVHEDGNIVSIVDTPSTMGTGGGRTFNWLVFGECDPKHGCRSKYKITIGEFKDAKGKPVSLFAHQDLERKTVPGSQDKPQELKATLLSAKELEDAKLMGTFTYTISISPERSTAKIKARAVGGSIEVCPVWPC